MNFHESKLFRIRPIQNAVVGMLSTATDRMKAEELMELAKRQFVMFEHFASVGLGTALQNHRDVVVPVGFLGNTQSSPTYVGATTEVLIDWASGTAPRFSIPLTILLHTARASFRKRSSAPTLKNIRTSTLFVVCIHLSVWDFLHRVRNRLTTDNNSTKAVPEVVFCIVVRDRSAIEEMEIRKPRHGQRTPPFDSRGTFSTGYHALKAGIRMTKTSNEDIHCGRKDSDKKTPFPPEEDRRVLKHGMERT